MQTIPPIPHPTVIIIYRAPLIIPITAPVITHGAIAVAQGHVLHVGRFDWVYDIVREEADTNTAIHIQEWHGLILPGLINAHTHLQYTGMAQVAQQEYHSFREWEQGFNAIYDNPSHEKPWKKWAEKGAAMLVTSGTTAAADIVTDLPAAGALASQHLHGITYWEVMNWHNDAWTRQGAQQLRDELIAVSQAQVPHLGISPHAPYSLDAAPLLDLPDIARSMGMRLHIHLGETPIEAGTLPSKLSNMTAGDWNTHLWKNYAELKASGSDASAIQFVDQLGVLGPDVHIAHGVYASREDRRILRQRGVSVALCPRSNRITCTQADAPVARYLEEGNHIAVGTDSLSSSTSLDVMDDISILYTMALEQGYDRDDIAHRCIRMLTLSGAESMGLHVGNERIGQINPGAIADLAFFDIPIEIATASELEHTLEVFIRHGAGHNAATLIDGIPRYNNGALDMSTYEESLQ